MKKYQVFATLFFLVMVTTFGKALSYWWALPIREVINHASLASAFLGVVISFLGVLWVERCARALRTTPNAKQP